MKARANVVTTLPVIITRLNTLIGKSVAWLVGVMVILTFAIVVLRHGFDTGWIAMQEAVLYLHAMVFMLGAAYTLSKDGHVRVDIFYQRCAARKRAAIDVLGCLFFLLPMTTFIAWQSWGYAAESWSIFESSPEAGGLPGVFLLKSLVPLTATLLALQGIAMIISNIMRLIDHSSILPAATHSSDLE